MTRPSVSRGRSWWLAVPAVAVAAALVVLPALSASVAGRPDDVSPSVTTVAGSAVTGASVTWNGKDVSGASSPSSAISIQKGQTALVQFTFDESSATAVGNASISVNYLGLVLTTSKQSPRVVGGPPVAAVAEINWSFGPLYDALEGVFEFTASLLSPNGSTVWSESFYVFTKAPYLLESGAVIVLLVFFVAELYWAASAIRDARRHAQPPQAKAPPPSPGTPAEPGTSPPSGGQGPADGGSAGPSAGPPPSGPASGGGGPA